MAIVDGAGEDGLPVKDPRTIARGYQLELCRKAVAENIIVYLETGCGKTHIAVLLIYELGHLIRKPQKSVCVFLAPTVHLVQQQAMVIEHSTHFKVGSYFGPHKHLGSPKEWEAEIQKYEVLVMTPEILLHNLHHCFMKMETIALLIFDECHHAQKRHPYAQIMKEFYRRGTNKMPRVFGLTASPVIGRGGFHQMNYSKCINTLEHLLDAKVCSVGDKEEIEQVVPSPDVRIYFYQASINSTCHFNATYISKLEEIKDKCINHVRTAGDLKDLKKKARLISQLHGSIVVCLEKLGLWTAIEAIRVLQSEDSDDIVEIMEGQSSSNDNNVGGVYLQMASSVLDLSLKKYDDQFGAFVPEALEEPFFSNKLLILIAILSTNRKQDAKCIVFVSRIITARVLAHILGRLNCLSFWKCDFLVGFHTGLKSMSRHRMKNIVDKFRSGKANLLVATNVAEEGLDIQTCCLIIRFDLPATVASYIQSRGRARMQESEYLFLVERGNDHELNLVNDFISGEEHMNSEILLRTSKETFNGMENLMYNVETTGASISTGCSISLLHHYCSRLPRDEYYNPVPEFCFFDDLHGVSCHVVLPSNAPIRRVEGPSCTSKEDAKRVASLQACKKLHELGSLTDYLLPCQKNEIVGSSSVAALSKVEDLIDEFSGAELHEMIVPAILRVPWEESASHLVFHFYYLRFVPIPMDRCYRRFGLFLSSFLPKEVEAMQVDLHLAHSRIIKAELVPSGTITFTKAEIMDAVKFQEMCLKIMLDRSVFTADYVQLGSMDSSLLTSSTYYLLLPIKEAESIDHQLTVDWSTLRNCLSSPAFNKTVNTSKVEYIHDGIILQSATGPVAENEILNSLVFTPHNGLFFFISDIFHGINGSSRFKDKAASYAEYYLTKFNIVLKYPEQPFLKAKQLCNVHNLLRNRVEKTSGKTIASELKENFVELPPELCILKIKDFPRDIGSSLSLLPSLMHRLESILVAVELKELLSISFSEGSQVTANLVLEALTTEKCSECFSLERLEVLGDSFLKYAVSRHLFLSLETLDEGKLTEIRSSNVNNTNLYKLAIKRNLQVYIRDQCFNPSNFFAFGRPCALICDKDSESIIHSRKVTGEIENQTDSCAKKCCKNHQVLYRKTIADVVEALVGAFLVDSGFRAASAFLEWMGIPVGFDVDNVLEAWNKSRRNLTIADAVDVAPLENLLGYRFLNRGLLLQALTHASSNNSSGDCYQRLEFLGDAVVDYIITSYLYSSYPNLKPGHLTDLRALIVSNNSLGQAAARHSLHLYLLSDSVSLTDAINKFVEYAQTQASDGDLVEEPKCPKVLADLVESCAGALLLDSGFDLNLVWKFTLTILDPLVDFSSLKLNPVRELRELCQSHNMQLSFSDSTFKNTFSVQAKVEVQGTSLVGEGSNQSKRAAERLAANGALTKLKAHGFQHNLKFLHKIASSPCKQSTALIGYDESRVIMDVSKVLSLESLSFREVQESSSCDYTSGESFLHPSSSESPWERTSSNSSGDSCHKNIQNIVDHAMQLPSAKSCLRELCSAHFWEQPSFFCCKDEGPSHMKLFTYKVTVQVCGTTDTILECFSEPRNKKKDAAEHAAEGALWWLALHGYVSMNFTSR